MSLTRDRLIARFLSERPEPKDELLLKISPFLYSNSMEMRYKKRLVLLARLPFPLLLYLSP